MPNGVMAQVSGFGATNVMGGDNSERLQVLSVQIDECVVLDINAAESFCTQIIEGQGICAGDLGTPLILNGQLIGIASWFNVPCTIGYDDLYVRISNYRLWIGSITGV